MNIDIWHYLLIHTPYLWILILITVLIRDEQIRAEKVNP